MSIRTALATVRKPIIRRSLAIAILVLTGVIFVRFFVVHPQYFRALGQVSPWTIVWILALNGLMVSLLVFISIASLALCGKRLPWKENLLLTVYSSIANFFGPLQSGPGVRAAYLKTRHQVRLRDYTLATLLTLGFFACFSALFLLVGTRPWWQTLLALLAVAGGSAFVIRLFVRRDTRRSESQFVLRPAIVASLLLLAFLQVCVTAGWYYVELRAVNPGIHFSQALSYAGAANFSLFVSITPDGVGIREAFLMFSQHIHHVSTANIVSANVIDRAAYVLFLGLLFVLALAMHAKAALRLTSSRQAAAKAEQLPR